jgi:hypothetical protein
MRGEERVGREKGKVEHHISDLVLTGHVTRMLGISDSRAPPDAGGVEEGGADR